MAVDRYEYAKKLYAELGIDTDKALDTLRMLRFRCTAGRATMFRL